MKVYCVFEIDDSLRLREIFTTEEKANDWVNKAMEKEFPRVNKQWTYQYFEVQEREVR